MLVTVYHGSHEKIKYINYDICHLGWHAGTLCHAIDAAEPKRMSDSYDWENSYIYVSEIDVTDENTVTIPDVFLYDSDFISIIKKTLKACIKNQFLDNRAAIVIDDCNEMSDIRETLLNNGIKYIRYENKYESPGVSYCILDENINIIEFTLYNFLTTQLTWTKKPVKE